jgi:uncharacterized protein (DUF302 family)
MPYNRAESRQVSMGSVLVLVFSTMVAVGAPDAAGAAEKTSASALGYTKILEGVKDLATARRRVTAALKKQGFGVVTEIDVQAIVKKKLNQSTRPYVILGACNPKLSHAALEKDPYVGLLLPCNVIIFEDENGKIVVSFAKPKSLFKLVDDPKLEDLAATVDEMIAKAFRAL